MYLELTQKTNAATNQSSIAIQSLLQAKYTCQQFTTFSAMFTFQRYFAFDWNFQMESTLYPRD